MSLIPGIRHQAAVILQNDEVTAFAWWRFRVLSHAFNRARGAAVVWARSCFHLFLRDFRYHTEIY